MSLDYPPAKIKPKTDEYTVEVTDDYRWLEKTGSKKVRAWIDEQNQLTRQCLDAIPARAKIYERLKELYTQSSSEYTTLTYSGGRLFALKQQPPLPQPLLVALTSADDPSSEQVVIDPNKLDTTGATTIDWYVPSLDGKYVAASLSEGGSERGSLHIFETATGHELGDVIPRVQIPTGGGSAVWNADGTGLYYTHYPDKGERPKADRDFYQQVYYHELGSSVKKDKYVIGEDFPRIAEILLSTTEDGGYVLATVANGDGGEYAHYVQAAGGEWVQVTHFEDGAKLGLLGKDKALYLLSNQNAPHGKILCVPLDTPSMDQARVIVPESDKVISNFAVTETRLYVVDMNGGPSDMRVFDLEGNGLAPVSMPFLSSISQLVPLEHDAILFSCAGFIEPDAWYHLDPSKTEPTRTALYVTSPASYDDVEVVREMATSKDGTQVPLNIIRPKGVKLDGQNPTLLLGYGGFGICMSPSFNVNSRAWLDDGGIFVIANLRGGGEFGEDWHRSGMLTNKQNVFDDFIACAEHLIARGYTNPNRLASIGGSNGGLLMGAALTQRPDLFRAVLSFVGVYDMLRVERDPNGAFNVTEFGTVKNPDQFNTLYAYSPYRRVVDGVNYPAILFPVGENDGRVNPAHSYKMTARLQKATASDRPILLRTSASSGHGRGTALEEQIALWADAYAFAYEQLGR